MSPAVGVAPKICRSAPTSLLAATHVRSPPTTAMSPYSPSTSRTPGIAATFSSTAGSNVGGRGPLCTPEITSSALMLSWARPLMLLLAESRITVTPVTRAMPTMSAAAVMAVRRGLRPELSRPSLPGTDQAKIVPSRFTTGRLMSGVSSATPMKANSTPPRIVTSVLSPALPPSPRKSSTAPTAVTSPPATVIFVSGRSGVATSCMAAIGGMREARSAGSSAATTVITMPTANALITALAGTPSPARVRSPARFPNAHASSAPMPMPAARPSTEAIRPTATASSTTELTICRRPAPMARMSASSRVRCATMIENVLRIRNVPTSSATAAKPSRIRLKKDSASLKPAAASSESCLPVFTSYASPTAVATASRSDSADTPSAAFTDTLLTVPASPSISRCATGVVNMISLAPPMESRPPL